MGGFLDILLEGIKSVWWNNASVGSTAPVINFLGSGVSDVVYNPSQNTTDVTISGGGGGGSVTLTGGAMGTGTGTVATTLARQLLTFTTLYWDPANSSGFASDANTGANATNSPPGTGPIFTAAHLNALVFQKAMAGNTTINQMSDAPDIDLLFNTLEYNDFLLTYNGTFVQSTTATVIGVTVDGVRRVIHLSIDPTPYVLTQLGGSSGTTFYKMVVVGGANAGTSCRIVSVGGTNIANCSIPVDSSFGVGAISPGDTVKIGRGTTVSFGADLATNLIEIFGCTVTATGLNSADSYTFLDCDLPLGFQSNAALVNCGVAGMICYLASVTFGVYVAQYDPSFGSYDESQFLSLTGGVYVTGYGLLIDPNYGHSCITFGDDAGGPGAGFFDCTSPVAALLVNVHVSAAGQGPRGLSALISGHGNAGVGIAVGPGGEVSVPAGSEIPTITGTLGDFGFIGQNGGALVTSARAWDDTAGAGAGAYTSTRTCTWAHLAAAIGSGGFNFNAHNVATGALVVAI